MSRTVSVQFTTLRTCLINVPFSFYGPLVEQGTPPQHIVLQLSWKTNDADAQSLKKVFVGWTGAPTPNANGAYDPNRGQQALDYIQIDPQFGTDIGLKEGQRVQLEIAHNIVEGRAVHVEPVTEDDWEIIELHAGFVEDNLLSQIRAVYPGQIITVWILQRTVVRLRVVELEPNEPCIKLSTNAEVIIAPKTRHSNPLANTQDLNASSSVTYSYHSYLRSIIGSCFKATKWSDRFDIAIVDDGVLQTFQQQTGSPIAALTIVHAASTSDDAQSQEQNGNSTKTSSDLDGTPSHPATTINVRLVADASVPNGHIVISSLMAENLGGEAFDLVRLSQPSTDKIEVKHIIIHALNKSFEQELLTDASKDRITAYLLSLAHAENVILTNGMRLNLPTELSSDKVPALIAFKGKSNDQGYAVMNKSMLNRLALSFGSPSPYKAKSILKAFSPMESLTEVACVDVLLNKCQKHVQHRLKGNPLQTTMRSLGGVLICGNRGAGKTIVAKHIAKRAFEQSMTYCHFVECAALADERLPVMREKFAEWFEKSAWHAPSIVVLDDLDRVISAEVEHADSFRSRQLAECFLQIAAKALQRHNITMIATVQQQQALHPLLISSHLFNEIVAIKPPLKKERRMMLDLMISTIGCNADVDTSLVSGLTEGYLPADLHVLVERSLHEAAVRTLHSRAHSKEPTLAAPLLNGSEPIESKLNGTNDTVKVNGQIESNDMQNGHSTSILLTSDDFTKAFEGFTPISLKGVKLQKSDVRWADIGGLNETRKILLETLEWPTKYAAIFANCPLRLRSGLLLYGFPGCGKTLLASAVARECGLNFISVKGPELLNKYIGASEKSVRDLFDRASSAKPCVLFFDEFDSIAPKRGHDSTGVTDRVVNQMLTQMDGAEGLDGVYVLAATSRPDLIDPALLRPGRLDKSLLCDMPSLQERVEILQALATKLDLADDVDLSDLAKRCEGYSGADLQAVLYNAHLSAIHQTINVDAVAKSTDDQRALPFSTSSNKTMTQAEKSKLQAKLDIIAQNSFGPSKKTTTNTAVVRPHTAITTSHLMESLSTTRPSITSEEQLRLQNIYHEFISGRSGEYQSGTASGEIGGRTSLM